MHQWNLYLGKLHLGWLSSGGHYNSHVFLLLVAVGVWPVPGILEQNGKVLQYDMHSSPDVLYSGYTLVTNSYTKYMSSILHT